MIEKIRNFIDTVRWVAVGWLVIWLIVWIAAVTLPEEERYLLIPLVGFGISVTVLLLRERE